MRRVTPDVFWLDGLLGGNVYAVAVDGGVVLIDSGMPGAVRGIPAQLDEAGYAVDDLRAIILTHAHIDHLGGATRLVKWSGAQVLAHREDVPYAEGTQPLPYHSWFQRLMMRMGNLALGSSSHCRVDRALEDGEELTEFGGLRVLHTPGHTPGSICLYQPTSRVLFSGDLILSSSESSSEEALHFSVPQFSVNPAEARMSARRLVGLDIEVLCCGHGEPMTGGVMEQLARRLAASD